MKEYIMVNKDVIIAALEKLVVAIKAKKPNNSANALIELIRVSEKEGLNAKQIEEVLAQNGIEGGASMHEFIEAQYAAISTSES